MHQARLVITKLFLHETGTYNTQYRRPYETHLDGATLNVLGERLQGADKFKPSLLAGVANQFLTPQAMPEKQIDIPNGWNERRMRFMMEIEHISQVGAKITEIVLGYTNYMGLSLQSQAIDPNMEFYVNSTMHVRQNTEFTPIGNQIYSTVVDSSLVLADNNWNGIYNAQKDQRMRPEDVYTLMSRNHLPDQGTTVDMRTTLTNNAIKSRRSNNLSANYMAGILDHYKTATMQKEYGEGHQDILTSARGYAADPLASLDPFLSAVSKVRELPIGNTFTYSDLMRLEPRIDDIVLVTVSGQTQQVSANHQAGQTMQWGAPDRVTQVATVLSQSVPSLLMDLTLTRIIFKSTNRTMGSQPLTTVLDVAGFSNIDLTPFVQNFIIRLEHEVLRDLSFNNQSDYAIEMRVDLLGETWISISIDGQAAVDFVTPSFCDALLVPVVTSNDQQALTVSKDFEALVSELDNNLGTGPGYTNTIGVFGNI